MMLLIKILKRLGMLTMTLLINSGNLKVKNTVESSKILQDFFGIVLKATKLYLDGLKVMTLNVLEKLCRCTQVRTKNIIKWIKGVRRETTDILPIVKIGDVDDIFEAARQRLFRGQDISWEQHVVPVLTKATKTDDVLKSY